MQYHNNLLCVTGQELISIVGNQNTYKSLTYRGQVSVIQRSCYGKPALIEFESLPTKYKELLITKYGDPREIAVSKPFKDSITPDAKAIEFFSHYMLSDGRYLPEKYQREYSNNAAVLNAIRVIYETESTARMAHGGIVKKFWSKAIVAIENTRASVGHSLPGSETKLRLKYKDYVRSGYEALISGKFCNDNSRKVNSEIERLLMSLYTMPNKPFAADVHTLYKMFIEGKIQVVDKKTAELFHPSQFIRNEKPLEISRGTVWNYLNQPDNRSAVDIKRNGQFQYNNMHRPHHHRNAPMYSFSKISMDDRDLPRKLQGGQRVKAYYAYDVASGCVIGRSYSLSKDEELFLDCMQDLFRLIEREDLGMPMEVEVENHLVNKFFDDLAMMFPYLRICNPGNSQEKHAEHFNRAKKYSVEKKMQNAIGRWWAKSEAYRIDQAKANDEFIETSFTYERLVADDIEALNAYNNQLHPRQKKYPGKTRWQVLLENINPDVLRVSKPVVYKSIGERTETSINRNQYVTVQYEKYQLPGPDVMDKLLPNNYNVEARYLPDSEGLIGEVFLYQNGKYLCRCEKIAKYNTAKAEWEEADAEAYTEQAKYVSRYDKRKKDQKNNLITAVVIESETIKQALAEPVKVIKKAELVEQDINQLTDEYDPHEYVLKAQQDI